MPDAAEAIEEIDERSAHECLQRLVHVAERNALLQHFVAIDFYGELRHGRKSGGEDQREFRPFARRGHELFLIGAQEIHALTGSVFQDERYPSRRAYAGNRGRRKGDRGAFGDGAQRRIQMNLDGPILFVGSLAFFPFLQRHPKKRAVGVLHAA